uniref:hypothetical protein n=1 Tax=Amycolatopsis sp. CA-096443 TaxID=3239919 RepID=UPI003F49907B
MSIWATVITVTAMLGGALGGVFAGGVLKRRADAVARAHEWQLKAVDVGGVLMSCLSVYYAAQDDLKTAMAGVLDGHGAGLPVLHR